MLGGHCTKTWAVTQGAWALSSAEAEFYALVEGVAREGIGRRRRSSFRNMRTSWGSGWHGRPYGWMGMMGAYMFTHRQAIR